MERTQITLSKPIYDELHRRSRLLDISQSSIIRTALADYFSRNPLDEGTAEQTENPTMSYETACDLYAEYRNSITDTTIYTHPNKGLSEIIRGTWFLRNVNGLLARVGTKSGKVF